MDESNNSRTMNYFDQLPDEIITKIFRYILDDLEGSDSFWNIRLNSTTCESVQSPSLEVRPAELGLANFADRSTYKVTRNFRTISADETLRNLCLTCKRFARIINGRYFTTPDTNQWPIIKFELKNHNRNVCRNETDKSSACQCIKTSAKTNTKFMRYKKLEIYPHFLVRTCILKAIKDERSNLSTIVELSLQTCDVPPAHLHAILDMLPNIKRLSIYDSSVAQSDYTARALPVPVIRSGPILTSFELSLYFYPDGHPLMDYILDNLPAREIRMRLPNSKQQCYFWDSFIEEDPIRSHGWVRKYLARHKNKIRNFQFTFQDFETASVRIDELGLRTFEGFDYYIEEGNYEYSVISSGGRRQSKQLKAIAESVRYKKLELYSVVPWRSSILKAMEDERACLSEVVELKLHQCKTSWRDLSKMLATLPSIERLMICREKDRPSTTYYFSRGNESGHHSKRQRITGPVSPPLSTSLFDNYEFRQVHELILENPPAANMRVQFEQEHSCECWSERLDAYQYNDWM